MISLLIRFRLLLLTLVLIILGSLSVLGLKVQYDQSIVAFFAPDDPTVLSYQKASALFGNDQLVFIAYDDPELLTGPGMDRAAELRRSIENARIDGVVSVQSIDQIPLFWRLDEVLITLERMPRLLRQGALNLAKRSLGDEGGGQWATPTVGGALRAATDESLAELREKITAHPLIVGTLVDRQGTTTALVARLEAAGEHDAKQTITELREQADAFAERHGFDRPAVVGPPVLLADGFLAIEQDGRRLATAGMFLIGLVTLTATRSVWWAIVPLLAGWTVWLSTETILSVLNLRLSLSSGPMVAQIIVLTMPAASHLALHFRDDLRRLESRRAAAEETLRSVSVPILWCAAAATIGYGALLTSNVVPIRQFGGVLAVATAVASLLTLALSVVAMLPPVRLEIPVRQGSTSRTTALMNALTGWVDRHPALIVVGTSLVVLPIAIGMFRLEYESNYINAFKPETRVVRDYYQVESKLGGIGLVGLVLPVPETISPESIAGLRQLDQEIRSVKRIGGEPAVAQVLSLATVLDPENRLEGLPAASQEWFLSTKLDLIAASSQADLLQSFWNPKAERARTMVRISEQQSAPDKEAAFGAALAAAQARFGSGVELTGLSKLLTETTRGVVNTQWNTFTWATVGLLITLSLAFRGPKLAILAILPTMLSVALVLGLMGWLGLKLDIATALVASVALGLSVDDTFHCLLNFRRLRRELPFREALFASYAVSGPGVILSSLAVAIGFAVLRLSVFVPFSTFGTMVCIATAGSSLGNIILLPACLSLAHRLQRPGREDRTEPAPSLSTARLDPDA